MNRFCSVVILAAGDGKRMQSATPKVMSLLHGRPLIDYVVGAVEASGVCEKPVVVVSKKHRLVQDYLGNRASYSIQEEQLGTGHAVTVAEPTLKSVHDVMVLYGDMPFLKPGSIKRLSAEHQQQGNVLTLVTVTVPNFANEYLPFRSFARLVRDQTGQVRRSVEVKDANEQELELTELNPCYYCFRADWLWPHVHKLENNNAQKEYYLTDLVQVAIDQREKISSIAIDSKEAIGINTKDDLELANKEF